MHIYTGYVYIWKDTKNKFYYIGGHHGKISDRYICSSKAMKRAYDKRPETFKFKVLEFVNGTTKTLREIEQKWLNLIKDSELMTTENIKNKTCRYYNVKKNSVGGNGKGTNKGKSHPPWNKGLKGVQEYSEETRLKMALARKKYWELKGVVNNNPTKLKGDLKVCLCCGEKKAKNKYCNKSCSAKHRVKRGINGFQNLDNLNKAMIKRNRPV